MSTGETYRNPPGADQPLPQIPVWDQILRFAQIVLGVLLIIPVGDFVQELTLWPYWQILIVIVALSVLLALVAAQLGVRMRRAIAPSTSLRRALATAPGAALIVYMALEICAIVAFSASQFAPYSALDLPRRALGLQAHLPLRRSPGSLIFSPDGKQLAGSDRRGHVVAWSPPGPAVLRQLEFSNRSVDTVRLSPDGRLLAVELLDGPIEIRNAADGTLLRTLDSFALNFVFSADSTLLATSSPTQDAKVWRLSDGQPLQTIHQETGYSFVGFRPDNSVVTHKIVNDEASFYAFSPDGRLVAASFSDNSIHLIDTASGQTVRTLTGHIEQAESLTFSADGQLLASASLFSRDKLVRVWRVADGALLARYTTELGANALAFSPDRSVLAVSDSDGIALWHAPVP